MNLTFKTKQQKQNNTKLEGNEKIIFSPFFHLLVSVSAQQGAFAIGVLSDLYAFHHSTRNSLCPYHTPAW